MLIESLALAAAVATFDSQVIPGHERPNSGVRQLASARPYPEGSAGFAGRLWAGRVVMGGVEFGPRPDQGCPGPQAYGAHPGGHEQVYARIGHVVVAINPWQEVPATGLKNFEAARQEWLAEQGYTYAVRTFMNDANFADQHAGHGQQALADAPAAVAPGPIVPRAVIELAPDAPRLRNRLRVEAPRVIRVLPASDSRLASK